MIYVFVKTHKTIYTKKGKILQYVIYASINRTLRNNHNGCHCTCTRWVWKSPASKKPRAGWHRHKAAGALLHCWTSTKCTQALRKTAWQFLMSLNIHFPYDSAIPLLIFTQRNNVRKYVHTCSQKHHSSQPKTGHHPTARPLVTGSLYCASKRAMLLSIEKALHWYMQQHGWIQATQWRRQAWES